MMLSLLTIPFVSKAQTSHNMTVTGSDTLTSCNSWIYDDGGPNGTYSANCNSILVIQPGTPNSVVKIDSGTVYCETMFATMLSDYLEIFDGVGINGTRLAICYGLVPTAIASVTSTSGAITLHFVSDGSNQISFYSYTGFALHVSCVSSGCPAPSNVTASSITSNAATLSWADANSTAWTVKYATGAFDPDTSSSVTSVAATSTTLPLSNLLPNTTYYVSVRGNCGSSTNSAWSTQTSFRTACADLTVPYTYGFEDVAVMGMPSCWTKIPNDNSRNPMVSTDAAHGGTKSLKMYTSNYWASSNTQNIFAVLPAVDTTANPMRNLQLSFFAKNEDAGANATAIVGIMTVPTDMTTFVPVDTVVTSDNFTSYTVNLATYTGTGRYVAFMSPGISQSNSYFLDDISIELLPQCERPTSVAASNITGNAANISWIDANSSSWTIKYATSAFDPITNNNVSQVTSTTTSIALTGLLPNTMYYVSVQGNCASDNSPWSLQATFSTPCGYLTIPYSDNFESYDNEGFPTCWTKTVTDNYFGWPHIVTNSGFNSYPVYAGSKALGMFTHGNYGDRYAVLPAVDPATNPVNTLQMNFYARNNNTLGYTASMIFGVMTSPTDMTSFVPVDTVNLTTAYVNYTVSFASYAGAGTYMAIKVKAASGEANESLMDNLTVESTPSCTRPGQPTLAATESGSVTLQWPSVADNVAYNVKYGASGFNPATAGTLVTNIFTNTATITGLSDMNYDFYVRTDCGSSVSEWCLAPLTCHPGQYIMANSATASVSMCGGIIYDVAGTAAYTTAATTSVLTVYPSTPDSIVRLTGTYSLGSFSFGPISYIDQLKIYDGASTAATLLHTYTNSGTLDTIISTNGPLTIQFIPVNGAMGTTHDGFAIQVSCVSAPECQQPDNVTITGLTNVSASLTWPSQQVVGWQYLLSTNALNLDTTTMVPVSVSENNLSLTNLSAQTNYHFYLRTECSATDFSAWTEVTFTTPCDYVALPYEEDFENVGNDPMPTCWTSLHASSQSANPAVVTGTAHSGTHSLYLYTPMSNPTNGYAVLPGVDPTVTPIHSLQISFFARPFSSQDVNPVVVGVMSNPYAPATFVPFDTLNLTGNYSYYEVNFSSYQGAGNYIALMAPATQSANAFYVDDVLLEEIPTCPKPLSLALTEVPTGVQLSWYERGNAAQWQIKYGEPGFNPDSTTGTMVSVTTNPYTITNLTPGVSYDFYVRSACSDTNHSVWSNVAALFVCPMPTALAAQPTANSALLTWTGTGNFEVAYKVSTDSVWSDSVTVSTPSYSLTGLTAATAYDWRVRKVCDVNDYSDWVTGTFTTLNEVVTCPMPANFAVVIIDSTSVNLSWNQEAGTATEWTLNYKRADESAWTAVTVTANPYTLSGLTPQTAYQAKIRANCSADSQSDFTDIITFTTPVGISNYELSRNVTVYPNPVNSTLNVLNRNLNIAVKDAGVYDIYGKKIIDFSMENSHTTINVSGLSAGVYFVRMMSEKGIIVKQFIKRQTVSLC